MASIVISTVINMAVAYACYYIAAQLAGKSKLKMPEASNYPLQTSMKGGPKQKIYGTTRTSGNVIWLGTLNPYTVKHDTGGKGGGQKSSVEETRYRRSFLISLGEGPMSVTRIWANDTLIWPYNQNGLTDFDYIRMIRIADQSNFMSSVDVTIFEGLSNSGVPDLTGLEYGEYKHDTLLFFNEYDLGSGTALPNIVAEVSDGAMQFFLGISGLASPYCVAKTKSKDTLDTDWGDSGRWGYTGAFGSTGVCYAIHQLADGRTLVAHNTFWIEESSWSAEGKLVGATMLTEDGEIDTSWGYQGFMILDWGTTYQYPCVGIKTILEDNYGNFYFIGECNSGSTYVLHKFDHDGNRLAQRSWLTFPRMPHAGCGIWHDAARTQILIWGNAGNYPNASYISNCCLVSAEDLEPVEDGSWGGNIMYVEDTPSMADGYANIQNEYPPYPTSGIESIIKLIDGSYVAYHGYNIDPAYKTLSRFTEDGKNYVDSFGTNGHVAAGLPMFNQALATDGNFIFTVGRHRYPDLQDDRISVLSVFDENGILVNEHETTHWDYDDYHCVCIAGGALYYGTQDQSQSGAEHPIERWTKNLSYIDGIDITGFVSDIILVMQPLAPWKNPSDCNPAYIINDFVTNTRYGGRLSSSYICDDCLQAAENYWGSIGALISVKLDESRPWQDWVDYILAHCGGSRNFDGGKLHIRPFRDEDSQFTLTEDDIIQPNPDNPGPKVQVTKRPYSETYNRIEVVWTDREHNYDTAVAVAQDEVDQRISGQIRKKTINLAGIHEADMAAYMAERILVDSMYRFDIFKFSIGYKNMLIELGDVGTLTCEDISSRKIRIMSKDESEHGRNIVITAFEEYSHFYPDISVIHYQTQANQREEADPITFENSVINFLEDITEHKLLLSVVPGAADVNGWLIYQSYDNLTYDLLGRCGISGVTGGDANSSGTIQNYIPEHPAVSWSPTETVLVSIGTVTDLHTDTTESQFWNDLRLAKIGNEIIAFRDAEETATAGIWQISCLRRGLFGTEPVAHYSGETFCTLDKNFTWKFGESDIGKTVYFKAVAFYGDIVQDISDVTAYSVTIGGYADRPAAAGLLRLTSDENDGGGYQYSGATFTLYWNLGSRVSGFNFGDWLNLPWNNYIADAELQAVVLKFEEEDGTAITEREISVGSSTTITKATDLGGFDRAVIKVVPRRAMESRLENSILVESV